MKRTSIVCACLCVFLFDGLAWAGPTLGTEGLGGLLDEEVLSSILKYVTATGAGAELLDFTTRIGAGVERSAAGIEDNPLTDLIDGIEAQFGSGAAAAVERAFDGLIETLGPSLLADVEPMVLPPAFDIDNRRADAASVSLPDGPYILDIGNTHNVGDGEFARVVLGLVDSDGDDNDAEQILNEIMTGASGANLDFEQEPGIVGVDLVEISRWHFTLGLEDNGFTDLLTFTGPGTEAVLDKLDTFPVPAPGSVLLLSTGLMGIAGLRRKRMLK